MSGHVDEPVLVATYDPSWPRRFERERRRVARRLAGAAVAIEHIGSTAVPGLDVKPVVDILVGVAGPLADHAVTPRLQALGYELLGEAGVPGRLYFRRRLARDAFNVHVVAHDGALWENDLLLRDFLRTHPAEARAYAAAKRLAATEAPDSLVRYSELKADAIGALVRRARAESGAQWHGARSTAPPR